MINSFSSQNENNPVEPTLDQMIGQMLLIGFRGKTINSSDQVVQDISCGRVGGVILFDKDVALSTADSIHDRNIQTPEQVKNLIISLQSYSKIPLFISVDQEGGTVARLNEKNGFPHNISQEYLGTLDNPDSTRFYGDLTALALKDAGFNLNFAPVVDLNINPDNPVIGKMDRSFSLDPNVVIENAEIIIQSHHDKGVFCTLKHFPGHGSSTADSHQGLVDVTNTWSDIELEPYRVLINTGKPDVIMTAHIYNAHLDSLYPATLSKSIITGLLRNTLHYKGVVISDDMNMKAISDYYGIETAIELSIKAGVDILCFANNSIYDEMIAVKATDIIKKLVNDGKISTDRIRESYLRIMSLKIKFKTVV
jgi:beta-N-acetylhexosaminidase